MGECASKQSSHPVLITNRASGFVNAYHGAMAEPTRARTRTNDPEGLRRRVIDAAAQAFQSRGYRSATMQEITGEVGATGGAVYHHFPTKKSLGLAVIRERVAVQVEQTWVRPISAASSAAQGIAAVFKSIIAELEARGSVIGCPVNNLAMELSLADGEFREALEAQFEAWRQAIAGKLKADKAKGMLPLNLEPDAFASFVVSAYSGAMAQAKTSQTTDALRVCVKQLRRLLQQKP